MNPETKHEAIKILSTVIQRVMLRLQRDVPPGADDDASGITVWNKTEPLDLLFMMREELQHLELEEVDRANEVKK
jgi:hypothetical protein